MSSRLSWPDRVRPKPGALQTRELEKRRKKRRRKWAQVVLVLGISIGLGWCEIQCAHLNQPTKVSHTWPLIRADERPAGVSLPADQADDYSSQVDDASADVEKQESDQDDYRDFGTYVISAPASTSSSPLESSQASLAAGSSADPRQALSQVLFYAAKSWPHSVSGDASNSNSSDQTHELNSEQLDGDDFDDRKNVNNARSTDEQERSVEPRWLERKPRVAATGQLDELDESNAKWLSKMNDRLLTPADHQLQRTLEPSLSEPGGGSSSANRTSEHQQERHNIYYWRLVWFVLPVGATFGNLLVIMAVYLERSLQSVTNYFIVSLAFADLFVGLIVMPFAVYVLVNGVWELGDTICDMYVAVDVTCSTASILNLVAISIDRYRAVAHPLAYSARSSSWRALLTILLAWLISCCVGAPIILGLNTTPERQSDLCILYNSTFIFWSSLTSFYVPCIIMIGLYWRIFLAIRNRTKKVIRASATAGLAVANLHRCSPENGEATTCKVSPGLARVESATKENNLHQSVSVSPKDSGETQTMIRWLRDMIDRQGEPVQLETGLVDGNVQKFALKFALQQIGTVSCSSCIDTSSYPGNMREKNLEPSQKPICCRLKFISHLIDSESLKTDQIALDSKPETLHELAVEHKLASSLALLALRLSKRPALEATVGQLAWSSEFWFRSNMVQLCSSSAMPAAFRMPEAGSPNRDKIDVPAAKFRMKADHGRHESLLLRLVCSKRGLAESKPVDNNGDLMITRCACCARYGHTSVTSAGLEVRPSIVGLIEPLESQVLRLTSLGQSSESGRSQDETLFVYSSESGLHIGPQLVMLWEVSKNLHDEQVGRQISTCDALCDDCISGCILATFRRSDLEPIAERPVERDNEAANVQTQKETAQNGPRRRHRARALTDTCQISEKSDCSRLSHLINEERKSTMARLASASLSALTQALSTSSGQQNVPPQPSALSLRADELGLSILLADRASSCNSRSSACGDGRTLRGSCSSSSGRSSSSGSSSTSRSSSIRTCCCENQPSCSQLGAPSEEPGKSWLPHRSVASGRPSACAPTKPEPLAQSRSVSLNSVGKTNPDRRQGVDSIERLESRAPAEQVAPVGVFHNATRGLKRQSMRLSRMIRRQPDEHMRKETRSQNGPLSIDATSAVAPTAGNGSTHLHDAEPSMEMRPTTTEGLAPNQLQSNLLLSGGSVAAHKSLTHQGPQSSNTHQLRSGEPTQRPRRPGSRRRREKNAARRERKATKTLAIVLGIFLICWTPFFTCNIIDGICIQLRMDCRPGMMVYLVTTWLGYINSCVNPLIYTIFNIEFRRAFKKILCTSFACCRPNK